MSVNAAENMRLGFLTKRDRAVSSELVASFVNISNLLKL